MPRTFSGIQRPIIVTIVSPVLEYEVQLIGFENGHNAVITGNRSGDLAIAVASAWQELSSWVASDPSKWTSLGSLRCGAAFETREGVCAIKSKYYLDNGQCKCIMLASGEFAHFPEHNLTMVREIQVTP